MPRMTSTHLIEHTEVKPVLHAAFTPTFYSLWQEKVLWGRGAVEEDWEEWREGKLCLGCIVQEKNVFYIQKLK